MGVTVKDLDVMDGTDRLCWSAGSWWIEDVSTARAAVMVAGNVPAEVLAVMLDALPDETNGAARKYVQRRLARHGIVVMPEETRG